MSRYTGPNFEVDSGIIQEWTLTASTVPEDGATAVLRLGRRVIAQQQLSFLADRVPTESAYQYATVYQDDALEIDGSVIDVVLPTVDLAGIEYLWQVDLISPGGDLVQRWRGIILVTSALPSL